MELGVADPVPALNAPAIPYQPEQGFWRGAQACQKHVDGAKGLAVTETAGRDYHDPAGADPGLTDVLRHLLGPPRRGNVTAIANLLAPCHKRDLALSLELRSDLAMQRLLIRLHRQEDVAPLLLELPKNGRWAWSATP